MKKLILTIASLLLFSSTVLATTDNFTIPHNFNSGETISSSKMNENFDEIASKLNELIQLISSNISTSFKYIVVGNNGTFMGSIDLDNWFDIRPPGTSINFNKDSRKIGNYYFSSNSGSSYSPLWYTSNFYQFSALEITNLDRPDLAGSSASNSPYITGDGNNYYIVINKNSELYHSTNMTNWVLKYYNAGVDSGRLFFINNTIIFSSSGTIYFSNPENDSSWSETNIGSGLDLRAAAYIDGKYIIAFLHNDNGMMREPKIYSSSNLNAITLIHTVSADSSCNSGSSWPENIEYVNGKVFLFSFCSLSVSSDSGTSWSDYDSFKFGQNPNPIVYFKNNYYMGGEAENNGQRGIFKSADGLNWTLVLETSSKVKQIKSDGENIIAIGEAGQLLISTDGSTWTAKRITGQSLENLFIQ